MSRVAVLKGGRSLERTVSLSSAARVEDALERLGHEVLPIDVGSDLVARLREGAPDVAFVALHGEDGEDGPGAASSTSGSRRIRIADTRENRKLFAHAFPDQITGAEGDDHEHVEAQFTAEKAAVAAEDDDRVEDATIPGWGSWTGPGIREGRSKRKFLKTIPGIKKKEDRRDAKLERVIINEKRIKKVSYPSSGANLC